MKALIFLLAFSMSSCATVLTSRPTNYQLTKPAQGEPARQVRWGWAILDLVIFPPFLVVDIVTKKIYKPYPREDSHLRK